MDQKTVFISYRRSASKHLARSIYQDLKMNGWDAFLDVNTIDSGDFDRIILNQIGARAHFVLLVSAGAMERCTNPDDWLRREIAEAVRLGRNIVPILDEGADLERELRYLPDDLREIIRRKNGPPFSHYYFEATMEALRTRFLKTDADIEITAVPSEDEDEVRRRLDDVDRETRETSIMVLPAPFLWVPVPGDSGKAWSGEPFAIAKYPVTNAQFQMFVDAGGYNQDDWWTNAGWQARAAEKWSGPRFWHEPEWSVPDQPVVGVSWYEAVAFCLWLSSTTGESIMLPTDPQWQYAAQGDDGRAYPWGDAWDCAKCRNSVAPCESDTASIVTAYEGRGDSPFGVVDMAGNVWEWTVTDYDSNSGDPHAEAKTRILRGGSWDDGKPEIFRCDHRNRFGPNLRSYFNGFRVCRSGGPAG